MLATPLESLMHMFKKLSRIDTVKQVSRCSNTNKDSFECPADKPRYTSTLFEVMKREMHLNEIYVRLNENQAYAIDNHDQQLHRKLPCH